MTMETPTDPILERVVFLIHALKQLLFGFEKLDEVAPSAAPGSAAIAFYMTAIYHHIAAFYLLDKGKVDPMGGAFYKTLQQLGHERLLDPVTRVLDKPIGATTFGEIVRRFRNKGVVHTGYRASDLDEIYQLADMYDLEIAGMFQESLQAVRDATWTLASDLIQETGYK